MWWIANGAIEVPVGTGDARCLVDTPRAGSASCSWGREGARASLAVRSGKPMPGGNASRPGFLGLTVLNMTNSQFVNAVP